MCTGKGLVWVPVQVVVRVLEKGLAGVQVNRVRPSNLTPEQKTKLNELRAKFREENAQLIGAMATQRIELQSLWLDPKAGDQAIQEKEKELRDLQNQLRDKVVQMRLEARQILTPEQIAQMGPGMGFGPGSGCGFGRRHGMGFGPGSGAKY